MDNLTHTLFAATLARTPLRRAGAGTTAALVLASNGPDIDIVSAFQGGSVSYLAVHRGASHGPLGVLFLAFSVAVIVRLSYIGLRARSARAAPASFLALLGVAALGVALHILMDLPTSYGTRLLSPFDRTWYAVDWLPIIDIYLWGILAAGLMAMRLARDSALRIAAVVLALMAGDYALRGFAHAAALSEARRAIPAPVRAAALPTFLSPFRWRLVRQFGDGYQLEEIDQLARATAGDGDGAARTAWFPDERNVWIERARETRAARVFLDFARFPAARARPEPDGGATVWWVDMRFVGGVTRLDILNPTPRSPFVVVVRLDRDRRVIGAQLGSNKTENGK